MAPPNTPDTSNLDAQLDAMVAQLEVLSYAPKKVTSALTDRFSSLDSSTFKSLATTLCVIDNEKRSGLVKNNSTGNVVSHHIKFDEKHPLRYCDVIYDNQSQQCTLLVKMKKAEKYTGSFKRATEQIAIQLDPKQGLRFCPVVSIKGVANTRGKKQNPSKLGSIQTTHQQAIDKATQEGALSFTCISGQKKDKDLDNFNRKDEQRAIEIHKGLTVKDAIKTQIEQQAQDSLSNLCHYVKQIGFQLAQMHQDGHTHFDVKLANILVQPRKVTLGDQTKTILHYTLIDIPKKRIAPNKIQPAANILDDTTTFTPLYSAPCGKPSSTKAGALSSFEKRFGALRLEKEKAKKILPIHEAIYSDDPPKLCGHMFDSYAFLIGLGEQIAKFEAKRNIEDLKPFREFFVAQMDAYLDAATAIVKRESKKWPDNLSVSGITESFTQMIEEKCHDKEFLQDALKDADQCNQTPSQPFNQTGNLPESHATTQITQELLKPDDSPPLDEGQKTAIANLKTASKNLTTTQIYTHQDQIQVGLWARVWDYLTSVFSSNSLTRHQAKKTLVNYCRDHTKNDDVAAVIQAITLIQEKNMVQDPRVLLSLVAVKKHLDADSMGCSVHAQATPPSKDKARHGEKHAHLRNLKLPKMLKYFTNSRSKKAADPQKKSQPPGKRKKF